jgi:arginase family enzyme
MSVRQLLSLLQSIDAPVVAADVVELNPRNDPSGGSAVVAGKVLRELLGVMLGRDTVA